MIAIEMIAYALTDLKRRRHTTPWGATWGSTSVSQEAEGEARVGTWTRAVVSVAIVVSTGRNGRGRASRLRNGYFE